MCTKKGWLSRITLKFSGLNTSRESKITDTPTVGSTDFFSSVRLLRGARHYSLNSKFCHFMP